MKLNTNVKRVLSVMMSVFIITSVSATAFA